MAVYFATLSIDMQNDKLTAELENAFVKGKMPAMIIAHRGASAVAQENTLDAFERAIELQADMIEFDVRMTRDRALIIHHDPDIQGNFLRELDLVDIRQRFPQAQLATLVEALAVIDHRALLNVEIKEADICRPVIDLLRQTYNEREYIITSLHVTVLREAKSILPSVRTGLIIGRPIMSQSWRAHLRDMSPWQSMAAAQVDVLSVHFLLAALGLLRGAQKRGIPVMVWTVNSRRRRQKLVSTAGVVGVIVNDPAR